MFFVPAMLSWIGPGNAKEEHDDMEINFQISNAGVLAVEIEISNILYVHPYLGKISNLTNIFQIG